MQHQLALDVVHLLQLVLDAGSVIADRHGSIRTAGRQIGHLAAQAIADHAGLVVILAFGQGACVAQRGGDVLRAHILVEIVEEAEGLLPAVRRVVQLHARLQAPEQVRHHRHEAFLGKAVGHFAHGGVHAEDFLADHHCRPLAGRGQGDVGSEGTGAVGGLDFDGLAVAHGVSCC